MIKNDYKAFDININKTITLSVIHQDMYRNAKTKAWMMIFLFKTFLPFFNLDMFQVAFHNVIVIY
jgi:hypothetical protein